MNVSGEESIYYQIVFEAQQAIDSLNQLDAAGVEFKNTLAQLQASFKAVAEAGGNVQAVADSLKRVNADLQATNEERIRATVAGEGNIQAALEVSRAKYVEVDAAITKLAADAEAAKTAQVTAALTPTVTPAIVPQGESIAGSVQFLREAIADGTELSAVENMARDGMAALANQYGVDAPTMARAMKSALDEMSAAQVKWVNENLTGEDEIRVALAQEAEQRKVLAGIIDAAAKNLAPTTVPAIAPEVLDSYKLLVGDVQKATLAMTEMQTAGKSNNEIQSALGATFQSLASQYKVDIPIIVDMFKQMGGNVKLTDDQITAMANRAALKQIQIDAEGAAKGLKGGADAGKEFENVLRMIEGVAVAMVVFQVFQSISSAIREAIGNAEEYYRAIQNITVAQDTLARSGVNVTNQQLLDIANQLHQQFQVSEADITKAVSQAALLTANYGFSAQQIKQIAEQAAILYTLDPSKPASEYVATLVKALEGSRSLGANNAQVAITAAEILAKAKELNLVSADTKSITDDHVKMMAALAIEQERLIPEADRLNKNAGDYLDTSLALKKAWADYTTMLGQELAPILNAVKGTLVEILNAIMSGGKSIGEVFETVTKAAGTYFAFVVQVGQVANEVLHGHVGAVLDLADAWTKAQNAAETAYNKVFGGGINMENTPTSPTAPGGTTQGPDLSKINSYLDSVAKDYQTYYDGVQKATENFNTKMKDLQDQYNLDVQKEIENTNLRIAEEKQNYRLKELKAEQDFQQKMRDLQARYLLDLEDALRKRDAEAVIRIIERYNMEQNSAKQQEDNRIAQDKKAEALRISQMKQEEELRLKQMAEEYALQQQRAQQAYNQQITDLKRSLEAKLQEEAVKIGQEYGMNQTGMENLLKLFNQYYGPNGQFAQSQQGSYITMIGQSERFVAQMEAIIGQYYQTMNGLAVAASNWGTFGEGSTGGGYENATPISGGMAIPHHQAQGGIALAASATDVTFGEAGPELAMFLPLNSSASVPSLGTALGAGGQFGGQAVISLQVDPNLEARIVNTTLTHAAISIEKVYRAG